MQGEEQCRAETWRGRMHGEEQYQGFNVEGKMDGEEGEGGRDLAKGDSRSGNFALSV